MDNYLIDENRKIHVCANNPECSGFLLEEGQFKIRGYDGPTLECHKCGSDMQLQTGRFGKYFLCQNDNCRATRQLMRNGEPKPIVMDPINTNIACEKVEDVFLLRDSLKGLFLAASQFPKNSETRAIKSAEIVGKPIILTENGIADDKDDRRALYIERYIYAMNLAMQEGSDVRGYFY